MQVVNTENWSSMAMCEPVTKWKENLKIWSLVCIENVSEVVFPTSNGVNLSWPFVELGWFFWRWHLKTYIGVPFISVHCQSAATTTHKYTCTRERALLNISSLLRVLKQRTRMSLFICIDAMREFSCFFFYGSFSGGCRVCLPKQAQFTYKYYIYCTHRMSALCLYIM